MYTRRMRGTPWAHQEGTRYMYIYIYVYIYIHIYIHLYTYVYIWHAPWAQRAEAKYMYVYIHSYNIHIHLNFYIDTEWRRPIGCLISWITFRKLATNCRALLQKMTYKDKASYESSPPCMCTRGTPWAHQVENNCIYVYINK